MNPRYYKKQIDFDNGIAPISNHKPETDCFANDLSPIVVAHLARSSANHSGAMVWHTIDRPALTTPSDKSTIMNNPG